MYPDKFIREAIKDSKIPQPPVGTPLLWFPQGNPELPPLVGFAAENNGRGQLHMHVIPMTGGVPQRKNNVWWLHDPVLQRTDPHRRGQVGAWDYAPVGPRPDMRALLLVDRCECAAQEPPATQTAQLVSQEAE